MARAGTSRARPPDAVPAAIKPARAVPLHRVEVAYGLAIGRARDVAALPRSDVPPRRALEGVLLRALQRPPCLVSFSGGLDSSALLALAVAVAREHGLPPPVPATLVFGSSSAAEERSWQELVLDHVGLSRSGWRRFALTDELDLVGPVAQEVLLRHGLLWPFNLHFHVPILEAAAGGSVITGFGGDELARGSASLWAERLIAKRRFRRPQDLALIGYRLAPSGVHWARELTRRDELRGELPWLTARGRRRVRRVRAAENVHPFGWGPLLRDWWWRRRYVQVCRENFARVAAPHDVEVVHPFTEPALLRALAGGRYHGLGDRRGLLEALVGDLLPEALLARTTKATFDDPLWTPTALAFAARWSGRGLDERLVDPVALRRHWLGGEPSAMSATLLQAAWLADHGAR